MDTQQLGDGPPGEEHYFDLEEEETQWATGSKSNPNAPTYIVELGEDGASPHGG